MSIAHTPLYDEHVARGGKMVEFCGYMLPVQYSSIIDEHKAVRSRAGVFDVSHMGRVTVSGPQAAAFLQKLTTNDVANMQPGRMKYAFMCNGQGGVKDDILVYKWADHYSLVVNAANHAKIMQHLKDNAIYGADIKDDTSATGHIALQGPLSQAILSALCSAELPAKYYSFADGLDIAGVACFVSRNGYTGEDGFEIIAPAADMPAVYSAIMQQGGEDILPCGLGCRDTLRLEAGMPLYGHELEEDITPLEAGLSMFVKLEGEFIGSDALNEQKRQGIASKRIGLKMLERGIPRQNCPVYLDGRQIGRVTSGGFCPSLNGNYAMALVDAACAPEQNFHLEIRGKMLACERVNIPFYKRP